MGVGSVKAYASLDSLLIPEIEPDLVLEVELPLSVLLLKDVADDIPESKPVLIGRVY